MYSCQIVWFTSKNLLEFIFFAAILPKNWRRYTVPQGLTVIQWIADFSDRVKQLQQVSQVAQTGTTQGLKVCYELADCFSNYFILNFITLIRPLQGKDWVEFSNENLV